MNKVCIKEKLLHAGQNFIEKCASTTGQVESLEKLLKIVGRSIEITEKINGAVSSAFGSLGSKIKDTILVFDSVKVISSAQLLLCRDKKGKYFLTNVENSIQKRLDRVCLAVHNCFKTVKGMKKVGFISLGVFAKNIVGKLPIFDFLTDSFIVVSSIFGTWDSIAFGLPASYKKIKWANEKLNKWKSRPEEINRIKSNDLKSIDFFKNKYEKNVNKIIEKIFSLSEKRLLCKEAAEIKNINSEILKLEKKLEKIDQRLTWIQSGDCLALAADLEAQKIEGYGGKIHKWTVIEKNQHISEKKNWLRLANSIGKIAVVTLVLTATALLGGNWSLPVALSVLFLGNVFDTIGLTKILYDEFAKEAPIPKVNPPLTPPQNVLDQTIHISFLSK